MVPVGGCRVLCGRLGGLGVVVVVWCLGLGVRVVVWGRPGCCGVVGALFGGGGFAGVQVRVVGDVGAALCPWVGGGSGGGGAICGCAGAWGLLDGSWGWVLGGVVWCVGCGVRGLAGAVVGAGSGWVVVAGLLCGGLGDVAGWVGRACHVLCSAAVGGC